MTAVRDFFGSNCPVCAKDILQQAPSLARMPPGEYAWCPSCESRLSVADLVALHKPRGSFLSRLFRRPSRA